MLTRRAGQKLIYPPGYTIAQQASSATARWLSGGISPSIVIAAYEFKGASSKANALINKALPGTYDAVELAVAAWSAANGFEFRADGYLDTGIVPGSSYSMFARFANGTLLANSCIAGQQITSPLTTRFYLFSKLSGDFRRYGKGGTLAVSGAVAGSSMCISGQQGYLDGIADGAAIDAWSGATTNSIYVGALHDDASASYRANLNLHYLYIYSASITAPQVAALHAATA